MTAIGGKWYINRLIFRSPPLKRPRFSKEEKKEDYIKKIIIKENYNWNDFKFQINCNNLKWVDAMKLNLNRTTFAHHNLSFI